MRVPGTGSRNHRGAVMRLLVLLIVLSLSATLARAANVAPVLVAVPPPQNSFCTSAQGLQNVNSVPLTVQIRATQHSGPNSGQSAVAAYPAPANQTVFIGCTTGTDPAHGPVNVSYAIISGDPR